MYVYASKHSYILTFFDEDGNMKKYEDGAHRICHEISRLKILETYWCHTTFPYRVYTQIPSLLNTTQQYVLQMHVVEKTALIYGYRVVLKRRPPQKKTEAHVG